MVLILTLSQFALISSADFDNVKSFDSKVGEYGKVTVKDWFGLQSLSELELKYNSGVCSDDCSAETEIVLHQDAVLIDDVRFMTLQEDESWKEQDIRSYKFYIKTGGTMIDVPTYEEQCDTIIIPANAKNGTEESSYQSCYQVQTGTKKELAPEWTPYNLGTEMPSGTYTIKLEGEKKPSRTVDWQITSQGKLIDEWAVWGGSGAIVTEGHGVTDVEAIGFSGGGPKPGQQGGIINITNAVNITGFGILAGVDGQPCYIFNASGEAPTCSPNTILTGTINNSGRNCNFNGSSYSASAGEELLLSAYMIQAGHDAYNGTHFPNTTTNFLWVKGWDSPAGGDCKSDDLFYQISNISFSGQGFITLNSPADNNVETDNSVDFNCSATAGGSATVSNISLWHNGTGTWHRNQTSGSAEGAPTDITGLTNYWKLDESSGTVGYASVGAKNMTMGGTGEFGSNFGLINNGWRSTAGTKLETDDASLGSAYSISFWVNYTGGDTNGMFMSTDSDDASFHMITGSNNYRLYEDANYVTSSGGELSAGTWQHYVYLVNTSGTFLYVDNVELLSLGGTPTTLTGLQFGDSVQSPGYVADGEYDEIGIWNRGLTTTEINTLYNSGAGYRSSEETLNSNFTTTITDTTLWTCSATDSDNDEGFGENRTVNVDSTPPTISILSPGTTIDYGVINKTEYLNWSISDTGTLDSCWYSYSHNSSLNTTLTCGDSNVTFTLGNKTSTTITLWANDSVNNVNSSTINWSYKTWENSRTFNSVTTEGASEIFNLNFTQGSGYQTSTVTLIYNSTGESSTYGITNNEVITSNTKTIPNKDVGVTVPFYWEIILSDGTNISTSQSNQTINILQLDNCSSYTNVVYNYTIFDEETQSALSNATVEIQLNLDSVASGTQILNFSQKYTNVKSASICLNNTLLTTVNYSADSVVKYYSNETNVANTSTPYATEYYHILNKIITNSTIPNNIKLYDLKDSDSTEFQLTFKDANLVLAPNILVNVYRQYVADNDFKVVEIPLTDSNGQTILHLVRNDVIYNLVMVNSAGTVVATFNKVTAFCQDFTIGQCTINLNTPAGTDSIYNYTADLGVSYTQPTFNNVTNLVSLSFTSTNLSSVTGKIEIVKNSEFGNRTVCSDELTSATGTLSCNVSKIISTDRYLFVNLYVDGDLKVMQSIDLQRSGFNFGITNGAFFTFLLILFLITMFMEDKQILVISLVVGWAVVISIGLMSGALFGVASAGIWLIVSAMVILWKLKKEEGI